jgi:hypothetical protein
MKNTITYGDVHIGSLLSAHTHTYLNDWYTTDILENGVFKTVIPFVRRTGSGQNLSYLYESHESEYGSALLNYTQGKYNRRDVIGLAH